MNGPVGGLLTEIRAHNTPNPSVTTISDTKGTDYKSPVIQTQSCPEMPFHSEGYSPNKAPERPACDCYSGIFDHPKDSCMEPL